MSWLCLLFSDNSPKLDEHLLRLANPIHKGCKKKIIFHPHPLPANQIDGSYYFNFMVSFGMVASGGKKQLQQVSTDTGGVPSIINPAEPTQTLYSIYCTIFVLLSWAADMCACPSEEMNTWLPGLIAITSVYIPPSLGTGACVCASSPFE